MCGLLSRWASSGKPFIYTKRCAIKFHILWYLCRHRERQRKKSFEWKTDPKLKITGIKIALFDGKSNEYPLFYFNPGIQSNYIIKTEKKTDDFLLIVDFAIFKICSNTFLDSRKIVLLAVLLSCMVSTWFVAFHRIKLLVSILRFL